MSLQNVSVSQKARARNLSARQPSPRFYINSAVLKFEKKMD
jgi:hypothetical protein